MGAHKDPRIDAEGICLTAKIGQTFKKIFPILYVAKYRYSINDTVGEQRKSRFIGAHHMM